MKGFMWCSYPRWDLSQVSITCRDEVELDLSPELCVWGGAVLSCDSGHKVTVPAGGGDGDRKCVSAAGWGSVALPSEPYRPAA